MKKNYISPETCVSLIQMEQQLLTGSAIYNTNASSSDEVLVREAGDWDIWDDDSFDAE